MDNKEIFFKFIEDNFPDRAEQIKTKFEQYFEVLVEANSKINLFSRKMPLEEIWITHFYDSLLPYKLIDSKKKRMLDFGTGGGLPGIPMAIVFPNMQVNLLDSTKKKILVLNEMIEEMQLPNVGTLWTRIEEYNTINKYDYIICRSVRIKPQFKQPLMNILSPKGKIILYKSKILDDIAQFESYKTTDLSNEILGTRNIIEIDYE
jgi:16S rRNA (guanine527-N7)-methyltransferase